MSEKTYTAADLKKALEDGYELGFRHGTEGKKVVGALSPEAEARMSITALNKSIGENSKKINEEILKRHRDQVEKHMKEWSKDADKALDEILRTVHAHDKK